MSLKLKCNSCDGIYSDSIDVRFTKACDNNCPYCIEKNGIDELGTDVEALIASTISSKKKDVLILGGEPFLYPEKLLRYVSGIREHVSHIYITTSMPKTILHKKSLEVLKIIDGLNVSTNHYDSNINNEAFRASYRHDRHDILKMLCMFYQDKIRVSINLVKGFIDDEASFRSYVCFMRGIGVKHIKVNELQNSPELYVPFKKVYPMIHMPSPFSGGCQTYHSILGVRMTVKRSCFIVEPTLDATAKDLLKIVISKITMRKRKPCAVIYENGISSDGWKTK